MVKKKQDNPLAGLPRFNVDPNPITSAHHFSNVQLSRDIERYAPDEDGYFRSDDEKRHKESIKAQKEIMSGKRSVLDNLQPPIDRTGLTDILDNATRHGRPGGDSPERWLPDHFGFTYKYEGKVRDYDDAARKHKARSFQSWDTGAYDKPKKKSKDRQALEAAEPWRKTSGDRMESGRPPEFGEWIKTQYDEASKGIPAPSVDEIFKPGYKPRKGFELSQKVEDMSAGRAITSKIQKTGKVSEPALPETSEKPVASKKKTKSGKGWMEIVSGPGAGTYKMPEEEKEARAAAKAGREALKAEGKGKRGKSGYETNNAEEITKTNEERKKASKEAGVWRESPYPNPIGVKSPKETPAVSAPTTEKSTTVATKKPKKKPEPIAQISAEEPKPKGKPKAQPKEAPASRVTEETAKQDETPAAPSNPMVLDDGGMPKGGPKYILNTDKSGSGTPEYGDINRARDVAAGKEQGFAAGSSKSAPAESSDGKRNKYIIGGGKSGVPARYGTMDEARAFAEQERTRQDRIGNGRVRAFGESSGAPTGGKATFYDFSDDDLGISKSEESAPSKPGFMERLRGRMRGGKKESVTAPSGATSTPPAPPAGNRSTPPPPPSGSFPPPSAGSRGGSFDAGHTGAGHSGAVKFAPQNQFTGGGINVGNQASANQVYGGNISGGIGNISGSAAPSNPVVASTGGSARSTNKNATVLSTGGDAVQSHPRAANAKSTGRPTTKKS